jgi:hypothetical protein
MDPNQRESRDGEKQQSDKPDDEGAHAVMRHPKRHRIGIVRLHDRFGFHESPHAAPSNSGPLSWSRTIPINRPRIVVDQLC